MQKQKQDIRRQFRKRGWQSGLAIVIVAALLFEVIAAIEYYYSRGVLEHYLEKQVLITLRASAMRMDGNLNSVVAQASNQLWHAQKRLDDPAYIETMLKNLVKDGDGRVQGAGVGFRAGYYPEKGRWYEPYAKLEGDSVIIEQIGSPEHDYFNFTIYMSCINGDTLHWSYPYVDDVGAESEVITYGLPVRDTKGQTVGVLGIDVRTGWIYESINELKLYPSSFTLVLAEDGYMTIAPADSVCSSELGEKIAAMIVDPAVKKKEKSGGYVMCFDFFDEQQQRAGRVYYALKESHPKWLLAKVVYEDEAFAKLDEMQHNILWTTLIGLLVLGLIIHLFARNGRKLQDTLIQQQRTDRELQIASNIQRELLPINEPTLAGVSEVQVEGRLIPAREVGGDLYNVFIRNGKLFFCIGDVSGKGVPASLIMAVMQTLFHNIASEEDNPARIMERMNVTACRNNRSNMFVTFFIGVLDLSSGHLDYCNAGHERPLLGDKPLDTVPNMPIGMLDDFTYQIQQTEMSPGDMLSLYTDGLTEARNTADQLFGRKGIIQLIAGCHGMSPREMVDRVIDEVQNFAVGTEQSDDLTLLAICYKPTSR